MSATLSKPSPATDAVTTYSMAAVKQARKIDPSLTEDILQSIIKPKRQIIVEVPLRRDDGSLVSFQGYRVQHNDARGPFKGGLRFHPTVDINEAKTLAHLMSLKTAVANIPFGGGKGGIAVDPRQLSQRELENLTRSFTNLLGDNIGPLIDIPAPDVNTTAQIMAWIVDEFSKRRGQQLGVVTGKPVELGGSLGRDEATGRGVLYCAREAAKEKGIELKNAKVIFQGFGNLASFGSRLMKKELGVNIVGVSTSQGAIYNKEGFDLDKAEQYYRKNKGLKGFKDVEWMTNDELLLQPCEILIPSALEKAITEQNAAKLKTKILIEGANDCTTAAADKILSERGVFVVPDILANAGGVVVSYFEWTQNLNNHYWRLDQVRQELERIMVSAYDSVSALATQHRMTLRESAYAVAMQRIARAMLLRGL